MSETTANLEMPYILPSQAQKHVTHNEALQRLDAVTQLTITASVAAPPATPAEGDCYLVAASPTGAFAGKSGKLAFRQDGSWIFITPKRGWRAWFIADSSLKIHDGSGFAAYDALGAHAFFGINTSADTTNRLAVSASATLLSHDGDDHRLKINKNAAGNTASLLFQSNWSGRAEFGLAGDDDFRVKVSADGSAWHDALAIDRASGSVALPGSLWAAGTNLLVNGDMAINQRGFAGGALAAGAFGYDRWKAHASGASLSRSGFDLTLTSLFVNGATETAVTPFDMSTLNGQTFNSIELTRAGFFDKTTYIGAVKDANDTWYQGWTCNSGTASFGTGNSGLCTSLPTS